MSCSKGDYKGLRFLVSSSLCLPCSLVLDGTTQAQHTITGVLGAGRMDWRALAALTSLQSLDLSFTGIQVHAPLEELLPLAHSLRVLNLSDNRIASLPAAVAKFARSV